MNLNVRIDFKEKIKKIYHRHGLKRLLPLIYTLVILPIFIASIIFPSFNNCSGGFGQLCIPPSAVLIGLFSLPGLFFIHIMASIPPFNKTIPSTGIETKYIIIGTIILYFLIGYTLDKLINHIKKR